MPMQRGWCGPLRKLMKNIPIVTSDRMRGIHGGSFKLEHGIPRISTWLIDRNRTTPLRAPCTQLLQQWSTLPPPREAVSSSQQQQSVRWSGDSEKQILHLTFAIVILFSQKVANILGQGERVTAACLDWQCGWVNRKSREKAMCELL